MVTDSVFLNFLHQPMVFAEVILDNDGAVREFIWQYLKWRIVGNRNSLRVCNQVTKRIFKDIQAVVDEKDCNVTLEFVSHTARRYLRLLRKAEKGNYTKQHLRLFKTQAEENQKALEETLFSGTMPATEIMHHDYDLWAGIDTRRLAENLRIAADFIQTKVP